MKIKQPTLPSAATITPPPPRANLTKFTLFSLIFIICALIGCSDGGGGSPTEKPQKQPDTLKTFTLGTVDCKVTIKSDDLFLTAEWTTLCNSVVATIERGHDANVASQTLVEKRFNEETVSVVLLKSATLVCEIKTSVSNTIYLKANASAIEGISNDELLKVFVALLGKGDYPS